MIRTFWWLASARSGLARNVLAGAAISASLALTPFLLFGVVAPWFVGSPLQTDPATVLHNGLALLYTAMGVSGHSMFGGPGAQLVAGGGLALIAPALMAGSSFVVKRTAGSRLRRFIAGQTAAALVACCAFAASFLGGLRAGSGNLHPDALLLTLLWTQAFAALGGRRALDGPLTARIPRRHRRLLAAGVLIGVAAVIVPVASGTGAAGTVMGNTHHAAGALVAIVLLLPNIAVATVLAVLGAPAQWSVTFLGTASGGFTPASSLGTVATVVIGLLVAALLFRAGLALARRATSWRRCVASLALLACACAGAAGVAAVAISGFAYESPFLGIAISVPPLSAALQGSLWAVAFGGLGASFQLRAESATAVRRLARTSAVGLAVAASGGIGLTAGGSGVAGGTGSGDAGGGRGTLAALLGQGGSGSSSAVAAPGRVHMRAVVTTNRRQARARARATKRLLQHDARARVHMSYDLGSGSPSFVRTKLPVSKAGVAPRQPASQKGRAVLGHYSRALRMTAGDGFVLDRSRTRHADATGMQHAYFSQRYRDVPVFGAGASVHFDRSGGNVVAISSSLVPDIRLPSVEARVAPAAAVTTAQASMPSGRATTAPKLEVYPAGSAQGGRDGRHVHLAWMVTLEPSTPYAQGATLYAIDATTGRVSDVIALDQSALTRRVIGPDGALLRGEGGAPVATGDQSLNTDANLAYDFSGDTYNYYRNTFGRDSYDGLGSALVSEVGLNTTNAPNFCNNAAWSPSARQMYYCTGFAASRDIVGHELTHAVSTVIIGWQDNANPTGALDESMSDVFGEMVERYATGSNDWLIGTAIAPKLGPYRAIRNLANTEDPTVAEPGPSTITAPGFAQCGEQHHMAAVTNHLFYLVSQWVGTDPAQRIWYRAMSTYLNSASGLSDMSNATIRAAQDLYGSGSLQWFAVVTAWNQSGVTSAYYDTGACTMPWGMGCLVGNALTGNGLNGLSADGPSADEVTAVLYRVRNELMPSSSAGGHFEGVYENTSDRATDLLLQNPLLQAQAAHVVQQITPGLEGLIDGDGSETMAAQTVDEMGAFLDDLAAADRSADGGELADVIDRQKAATDLEQFKGMTYDQVLSTLDHQFPRGSAQSQQDSRPAFAGGDPTP
jgi:Zn-dependent metalloprotease